MNVTFEHVDLSYDDKKTILKDLNFTIPDGKLVSLLGPSGGGKTTTLNLISGLLHVTKGQIFFGSKEVTDQSALERKVGMVFQNYALYPHLSVLDNIAFPLKMQKVNKAKRYQIAKKYAHLVHVEDQLTKKPAALSGGQQQRVAIARALAKQPSLLLLDEPLSNLDARLRIEMRQEIKRIQQETGITTIFVTHDQDEALHISDYVMVLNDGRIQQFTQPQDLYDDPKNLFVAKFIGNPVINVLDAADLQASLQKYLPSNFYQQVKAVGVRAEAILPQPPIDCVGQIQAQIDKIEHFGSSVTANISYHQQRLVSTGIPANYQFGKQLVDLYFAKQGTYFFDNDGKRLEVKTHD
ncbi:ABC transporter ATP-binding protein [Bombilactobacillus bombi]|uniref:ABC transporter ATP-binding protein n=1 Tax=Bombilactobacillus bombi TaxID=1303590 RepID=UPI0015E5C37E|nr:ABC transporter ATP-binding protein [Bombilactobacillus bombi]MBA1434804.1 ABC transporter ATP-binding protein [Bombilactobacillus bombi]